MAGRRDKAKFLSLLQPNRDSLYRFAARNVWNKDQVTDILQDAVMTAWTQFPRFEEGTNFRAWVFKILLNTIYRYNRKHGRSKEHAFEDEVFNVENVAEKSPPWPSILQEPERVMQGLDDRLVTALETLAPTERHCFLLRLLEDFSYKEISDQLNIPIGTVMSHVYRARLKLRERLAALAAEEGLVK